MSIKRKLYNDIMEEFAKCDNEDCVQHDIHPEIDIMYNSINIFLGQRGSGKTFNGFNIAALISRIPTKYHLFVFVSNNPNDETFRKFKPLVKIPSVLISYQESESFMTELIEYKQAYDKIKFKKLEGRLTDECKKDILSHLYINDFHNPSLHTLILYDDALEVFKKPNAKEFRYLLENRHTRSTYILNIQDWKGISPQLKANIDSVWMFGGYPRNRYCYIFNQLSSPMDRDEIYEVYKNLNKREALIFSNKSSGTVIKQLLENGETYEIFNNT
ncbi:hypothetical protein TVAG_036400 [Trichomonas vaginalis G3]|uniref:Uncharacterized protein n=1 Tax=Trichomonas vaginalis (strain ATCC PRA-98 / G3) TaxID=412133 RepID=A2DAW1_TRIV3|nr:hypothetical protein TVAGG3_0813020 [Trichomonas vaginalis G3]EAY22614.1 hypothetical protein TVAG_036400 [Trichomonas vaginalis G3]KAI5497347.1 hypothetical protein TVAGG3_0813020 [Trichomonas vaginalis G3]|eukprot:XP_001583600.1 hypothetical protein [Trichomonas vaginalis G3]